MADGTGLSPSSIYRLVADPEGRARDVPTLTALAKNLNVLAPWLLRGEGHRTPAEAEAARAADEREERVAALSLRLGELASPGPHPLHPAAEALLVEIVRRWVRLPDYYFGPAGRTEPDDIVTSIRELAREVVARLPLRHGMFEDRRDWDAFTISLFKAVLDGLPRAMKPQDGGSPIDYDPVTGVWIMDPAIQRVTHPQEDRDA